jgi:transposase
MEDTRRLPRRLHSEELKARVLVECMQPGASVAEVALSHRLNADLVHKWRSAFRDGQVRNVRRAETALPQGGAGGFVRCWAWPAWQSAQGQAGHPEAA